MNIHIANHQRRHRIGLRRIRGAAQTLLNALKHPDAELSLLFVGDRRIAELNRAFLGREGPTNVIAFPMRSGRFGHLSPNLLGDVVISVDTAHREAIRAGLEMEARLTQLMVHGVLHLCGYDHEHDRREARRMNAKSRWLVKQIAKGSKPSAQGSTPKPDVRDNPTQKGPVKTRSGPAVPF
jgi:probable rRNA maturation factor